MHRKRLQSLFAQRPKLFMMADRKRVLFAAASLLFFLVIFLVSFFNDARYFQDYAQYRKKLTVFQLDKNLIAQKWLSAADEALENPAKLPPSYRESGWFHPNHHRASAWTFAGYAKQTLKLQLTTPVEQNGYIFIDLLRREKNSKNFKALKFDERNYRSDKDASKATREFIFAIGKDDTYYLRLQPELLFAGSYELVIEVENAYIFPVEGKDSTDIRSFFGDPRDAGKRRHQGVDIFAARGTPVLAIADGRIRRVKTSARGGKHIWQSAEDGRRIYYAHLEEFAVVAGARVRQGDVIGFVGNTGNAINTLPHLHFEIREPGRGPLDPAPHIYTRRVDSAQRLIAVSDAYYARVKSNRLNLRAGPGLQFDIIATLAKHELLNYQGSGAQWSRVTYGGKRGYVFSKHIATQLTPLQNTTRGKGDYFYATPDDNTPLNQFSAADTLSVLGYKKGWILSEKAGEFIWLAPEQAAVTTSLRRKVNVSFK